MVDVRLNGASLTYDPTHMNGWDWADATYTEVVKGLNEGDVIVLMYSSATTTTTNSQQQQGGGPPDGGGPPPGG